MRSRLPNSSSLNDSLHEAKDRASRIAQGAQGRARDAQERFIRESQERLREAQERVHEAQERAVELARERAQEAQEIARRAAETMPPGLLVRILVSIVGIPLLLALVFADSPPPYNGLPFTFAVAICALVGVAEYFRALKNRGFQPTEALAFFATVCLQFAAWSASGGQAPSLLPALLAVLVIATLIYQVLHREQEPLANIGVTFLGVIWVGWLLSYLIFLRSLTGQIAPPWPLPDAIGPWQFTERGAWIVLYVFAVTWSTDAGAYFVGIRFGKTLLAPRLSPKKTYEGLFGGLIAATLVAVFAGQWIGLPWWHGVLLGPLLGALGQVGDLCESALKRDLGIKDFGAILPGHGGILDRFDSLLFTAPVAYYYLIFVVPRL